MKLLYIGRWKDKKRPHLKGFRLIDRPLMKLYYENDRYLEIGKNNHVY